MEKEKHDKKSHGIKNGADKNVFLILLSGRG